MTDYIDIKDLIVNLKPGWLSRLFNIMIGKLIALDAKIVEGRLERGEKFNFLYKDKLGNYYHLTSETNWTQIDPNSAKELYLKLLYRVGSFE